MTTEPIDVQSTDLNPAGLELYRPGAIVQPAGTIEEVLEVNRAYHELYSRLLDQSDFQAIGPRKFPKKSAWRKLSLAFNVSTKIITRDYERNDLGRIIRAEVVARAEAPNGRSADGLGACDIFERCCSSDCTRKGNHVHCKADCDGARHFSNPQHDIPATAATRATNRAASDLFGMGEVSAEEMNTFREAPEAAPEPYDPMPHLLPWLAQLEGEEVNQLRQWREANQLPAPRAMTEADVERTLVQVGSLIGARQQASTAGTVPPLPVPAVGTNQLDGGEPFDTEPSAVAASPGVGLSSHTVPVEGNGDRHAATAEEPPRKACRNCHGAGATGDGPNDSMVCGLCDGTGIELTPSNAGTKSMEAQADVLAHVKQPGTVDYDYAVKALAGHALTAHKGHLDEKDAEELAKFALGRFGDKDAYTQEDMAVLRERVEPDDGPDPWATPVAPLVAKANELSRRSRPVAAQSQMGEQ